jgi:hypothetical protein
MLLLVDNCEHVVDAAAVLIDDILSRCPGITVLATSREALAIPDEVQVTVGPLGTPPEHTAPGQVLSYPGDTAVRRTSSRGAPRVGVRRAEPDRDRRDHPVARRHPARGRAGCGRVTSLSPFIKELQLLGWGGAMKPPATSPQPRTDTRRRST